MCLKFMIVLLFIVTVARAKLDPQLENKSSEAATTFQATNNTLVPTETYIVSAVECLKEAYEVFEDDQQRASLYAALLQEKYDNGWSVVSGYEAFYVHSKIYVEILVGGGGQDNLRESKTSTLFLIFSTD